MNKFRVGDRVEYCGYMDYSGFGTITSVFKAGLKIQWDNRGHVKYHARKYVKLVKSRGVLFMVWNGK